MKKILLFIFILNYIAVVSQETKSRGKIVVPITFSFANGEDPYSMSSLTKAFFEKEGFEVFYDNNVLPVEIAQNRCNALFADIQKLSGFLVTKMVVSVKDCRGNILAVSDEGKSREKEFRLAYREAVRNALNTLKIPENINEGQAKPSQAIEVKPVDKQEAVNLIIAGKDIAVTENSNVYYAQPISNGYQLVDSTPKVVLRMFRTSQPDYYIANSEIANGVVFKKNNQWIYEYYQGDKLVSEVLQVKF